MKSGVVRRIGFCGTLACTLTAWSPPTLALDPALDVSQYAHTAWRNREGFPRVTPFAQTADGYLWLGTDVGLIRFDGVRTVAWQPPPGEPLPDNRIRTLLAARDGTLWIGTWGGLASLHGARLTKYPELAEGFIDSLIEDHEGSIWVGSQSPSPFGTAKLCAIRKGSWHCDGDDGRFGAAVLSLYEDSKERLWAATPKGLWLWHPGPPKLYLLPKMVVNLQALTETADGALLVATRSGIMRIVDGKVESFPLPAVAKHVLRDRDGALWVGTLDAGLLHVHHGRTDSFTQLNGLSFDHVDGLFEDREGNIWVSTLEGIDRFRTFAVPTYFVGQGFAVLASRDGSVWVSTVSGLKRWSNGQTTGYRAAHDRQSRAASRPRSLQPSAAREVVVEGDLPQEPASLFQDDRGRIWIGARTGLGYLEDNRFVSISGVPTGFIDSITEDRRGSVWIAHRDLGLLRVSADRSFEQIPWSKLGDHGPAKRLAADSSHDGLWLGFFRGGIAHVVDGRVRESYATADGLGKGQVYELQVDRDGTLWIATEGGLSRLKNGRTATLNTRSGLPCDRVDSMIADNLDAVWLYTGCGLVRIARSDLDAWASAVDRGEARPGKIRTTVLDNSDGISGFDGLGHYSPHASKSTDGRLFLLARADGVSVVDPRHLVFNALPPPVHIEQITADHEPYDASPNLRLPPLIRDLSIDYTALSLAAPERVQFRYRLEGHDRDWQNPGSRRQAFYTNLAPGQYRFRVIASNNSGVWNEQGDVLEFSIPPAYWQTNWFRALCVAALLALLWLAFWLRARQLARQFNRTLEARVGERTRIARELHDTLLQSFHGLLLRFQTVLELLPSQPERAKQNLQQAVDQAAEAITEGREAVQGLRASVVETNDLALSLQTFGEQLAGDGGSTDGAGVQVVVEGAPRPIHPILRDEIYRIGCEAMRNAFRHAAATQIEIQLRYEDPQLRLRVRDDGKGIDPAYLEEQGREGHFGLRGMRERAELIGGKLTVWSAVDSGTEVELIIPADRAYVAQPQESRSWLAERIFSKEDRTD